MKGAVGATGQTGITQEELDKPRYGLSLAPLASIFFH
ncbi:hypothetical protein BQ9231_00163 [Cedratvirus lausannensis]|uniref:Uncharacterized protein n=1 Tax=Cedratvirus lausannensis TaxID=2023205 RepID=A0A285PY08_9VIRU|nr:hypothetical protein BQ9231_00163 [Cedratvirus lausannensis]